MSVDFIKAIWITVKPQAQIILFLEEVKLKDCPLVEVPTPHGRLIDADKVLSEIREIIKADAERGKITFAVDIFRPINNAPTVIDAEE